MGTDHIIREHLAHPCRSVVYSTIAHIGTDKIILLTNVRNNPIYLLCFAAGNPKGAPTALKIADHILSHQT